MTKYHHDIMKFYDNIMEYHHTIMTYQYNIMKHNHNIMGYHHKISEIRYHFWVILGFEHTVGHVSTPIKPEVRFRRFDQVKLHVHIQIQQKILKKLYGIILSSFCSIQTLNHFIASLSFCNFEKRLPILRLNNKMCSSFDFYLSIC